MRPMNSRFTPTISLAKLCTDTPTPLHFPAEGLIQSVCTCTSSPFYSKGCASHFCTAGQLFYTSTCSSFPIECYANTCTLDAKHRRVLGCTNAIAQLGAPPSPFYSKGCASHHLGCTPYLCTAGAFRSPDTPAVPSGVKVVKRVEVHIRQFKDAFLASLTFGEQSGLAKLPDAPKEWRSSQMVWR